MGTSSRQSEATPSETVQSGTEYIIITPCHNEASYIHFPLKSVLAQTIKPLKWIIVDDGSSDGTAAIIKEYEKAYGFIEYRYRERPASQAYFASNVFAIMDGYKACSNIGFDYLAILDADIELPPNYYETLMNRMALDTRLGICSGVYLDCFGGAMRKVPLARQSTPKAIQFFRKECFESIGGYIPFRYGGEDSGTEILARMGDWQTMNFPDVQVHHMRPMGLGSSKSLVKARFKRGYAEYSLGTHPLFLLAKYARRMLIERPFIVGAAATVLGYVKAGIGRIERQLPAEAIDFVRREQMSRLAIWKR